MFDNYVGVREALRDITSIGVGTGTMTGDAVILAGTQTIVVKGLAGSITTLDDIEFV